MIPNPWLVLGVCVMWAVSLVAVGRWQREDGAVTERASWLLRDTEALRAANTKIAALNAAARAREAEHAAQMDAIGKWLAKETQDAEARQRRAVASARALVLRNQPACGAAGGGSAAEAGAASSGSHGAPACELPATSVRDLFLLVGDADRGMRQLAACQSVVTKDREQ